MWQEGVPGRHRAGRDDMALRFFYGQRRLMLSEVTSLVMVSLGKTNPRTLSNCDGYL
jgi:hypothetical protein